MTQNKSANTDELPKINLPGKPNYEKLGVDVDFLELFYKVEAQYETCFLLESLGEEGHMSRYSLIGFSPESILRSRGSELYYEPRDASIGQPKTYECENPYFTLREIVPTNVISRKYAGGLVGYLGYDAMNYFEPTLDLHSHDEFDGFRFGVYKDGLVFDKMTGELFYYYYDLSRLEDVQALIDQKFEMPEAPKVTYIKDTMSQENHANAVNDVKEKIINGLIFQCEVGFKSLFEIEGSKVPIYQRLREVNPSPHMYYMKFGDQAIVGASPELLFRLRQGEMETFPLAGTAKRGKDQEEDTLLARALLNDPKEIAEHNMLVDLHRNDLGRVARFGTVKVRNLMDIKRYSHVQHISSDIVGILAEGEDMFSALAANFPAGTLTGAPKIEAMKIINSMEGEARGPYGGAVGQFSFNGDCTFAIPIRSIFINGKEAYAQTCGGNVFDSTAEGEYLEIQRKLAATKKVLSEFGA
jgi:anthranilate synthase component I